MLGLDTNVLVRYIVQDNKRQNNQAARVIQEASEQGFKLHLNEIVLCEFVWVLESAYDFSRETVADVLEKILTTKQFAFKHPDKIWRSFLFYKKGPADFADYLIGELNLVNDCDKTVTFDKSLKNQDSFQVL